MNKIKVQYFTISRDKKETKSLEEVFVHLKSLTINQRIYNASQSPIRLEYIDSIVTGGKTLWVLRFARMRDSDWPGVATPSQESKDLNLDPAALLTEETFSVFDLQSGRVAIHYNHYGVRASKIQNYITVMGNALGYTFFPVLNQNILEKYKNAEITTTVEATIDGISDADVALFQGHALLDTIKQSLAAKVQRVDVSFIVDARFPENKIDDGFVDKLVKKMFKRNSERDSLKVKVKADKESTVETLDLFEDLKVTYIDPSSLIKTSGRRFQPESFNKALVEAMSAWL